MSYHCIYTMDMRDCEPAFENAAVDPEGRLVKEPWDNEIREIAIARAVSLENNANNDKYKLHSNIEKIDLHVLLSDSRLLLQCNDYYKGNYDWTDYMGVVDAISSTIEKSIDKAVTKNKCLLGMIRYEWIRGIYYSNQYSLLLGSRVMVSYEDEEKVNWRLWIEFAKHVDVRRIANLLKTKACEYILRMYDEKDQDELDSLTSFRDNDIKPNFNNKYSGFEFMYCYKAPLGETERPIIEGINDSPAKTDSGELGDGARDMEKLGCVYSSTRKMNNVATYYHLGVDPDFNLIEDPWDNGFEQYGSITECLSQVIDDINTLTGTTKFFKKSKIRLYLSDSRIVLYCPKSDDPDQFSGNNEVVAGSLRYEWIEAVYFGHKSASLEAETLQITFTSTMRKLCRLILRLEDGTDTEMLANEIMRRACKYCLRMKREYTEEERAELTAFANGSKKIEYNPDPEEFSTGIMPVSLLAPLGEDMRPDLK